MCAISLCLAVRPRAWGIAIVALLASCSEAPAPSGAVDSAPAGSQPSSAAQRAEAPPGSRASQGSSAPEIPVLLDTEGVAPELVSLIEGAVDRLRRAPSDSTAWMDLAQIYDANQVWSLAGPAYERALALEPDAITWYHVGRMRAWLGDAPGALLAFEAAGQLREAYSPTQWRKGNVLLELGDLPAAKAAFERAIELAPKASPGRLGLARIHLMEDDAQAVVDVLEPLIEASPMERFANGLLARAYHRLGLPAQADRAERREQRSAESSVNDPWVAAAQRNAVGAFVIVERASNAMRAGDTQTAIELLLSADTDLSALDLLVRAYLDEHRTADALAAAERARELHGDHYRVQLAMGRALAALGELERARSYLRGAVKANPRFAEALAALGEVQLRLGKVKEAAASFQAGIDEGRNSLRDWSLLARAHILLEDPLKALEVLEEAMLDFPSSPTLWGHRADAEARAGRFADARESLKHVEARDPDSEVLQRVRERIEQGESAGG